MSSRAVVPELPQSTGPSEAVGAAIAPALDLQTERAVLGNGHGHARAQRPHRRDGAADVVGVQHA